MGSGFNGELLTPILDLIPRRNLSFYEKVLNRKDFQQIALASPIYYLEGNCAYSVNLTKGNVFVPDEEYKELWTKRFLDLELRDNP